ncbi:MAG: glycosyltransferase family 39 protein [Chloroflexi bacterium]|nr:MAG: glycosyltransferase family 39 protein [Chloroflexota bacterium]
MVNSAFRVPRSAFLSLTRVEATPTERAGPTTDNRAATERGTRNAERGTLVAIIALAAVVRLWGLGGQPILYFDSGVYLGEGAFLASAAQRAAAALIGPGPANPLERVALATQDGTDAHPPDIAKPGHAILLAVSMLLLGKTALAGALVSALAGVGTVAATYAIGLRGWGPRVAIPAAWLLAVSGQHLVYSREPLVEADGLLFATLAALVYLQARSARSLLAAGVLWGLAFTCNNRLSYLPAVFLIAELAWWPGVWSVIRRGFLVATGFVAPLALIEGAYVVARAIGGVAGARTDWLDYVQQLAAFSRMNPPDRVRFDEWPTYFVDLALMDGFGVLALLMIGIGVLVWRLRRKPTSRADLLLAGSLLVPLALYSVYSTGEVRLRHFSLALPWVMLAAALALDWLARLINDRRRNWILVASIVVLVVGAVPRVAALDTAPSGMPAVLDAIASGPVASTNGPVLAFYVGEGRTNARLREAFVNVPSDLRDLAQQYPVLVVDMQAEVFAGDLTDLYARTTPRLVVSNGNDAWYLADLLEHYGVTWGGWNDLLAKWHANRDAASQLRVYDLRELAASVR